MSINDIAQGAREALFRAHRALGPVTRARGESLEFTGAVALLRALEHLKEARHFMELLLHRADARQDHNPTERSGACSLGSNSR